MGELIDKAKGTVNVAVGKAKQNLGEKRNDPEMIVKGSVQAAKGHMQKAKGAIEGALGDKV